MMSRLDTEADEGPTHDRRSDHDVTNTVDVSSPKHVCTAVRELFEKQFSNTSFDAVWLAFRDFERLYTGQDPEYHAVDTSYHDIQHTLDVTLALARLIVGHERSVGEHDRVGPDRARFALVAALFHDVGYLRHRERDRDAINGAVFTSTHVSRSGAFLEAYLPRIGLGDFADIVSRVVHFTGYEMPLDDIELEDTRDTTVGHLLGTADLLVQMADRCYLEKCRDRLYPEFVLGGVAANTEATGTHAVYRSGRDLLQKTMDFFQLSAQTRLETKFDHAYRFMEAAFEHNRNPYLVFVTRNLVHLKKIQRRNEWGALRRRPRCVVPDPNGETRVMLLALSKLRELSETERANSRRLKALDPGLSPATPP